MQVDERMLDEILALQSVVAWAGEGLCEPPRLAWWRTDLVDEAGGGDLFRRLPPRTHAWAGPEAARTAAIATDRKARATMGNPDHARTLFHWGFELDEQVDMLAERFRLPGLLEGRSQRPPQFLSGVGPRAREPAPRPPGQRLLSPRRGDCLAWPKPRRQGVNRIPHAH